MSKKWKAKTTDTYDDGASGFHNGTGKKRSATAPCLDQVLVHGALERRYGQYTGWDSPERVQFLRQTQLQVWLEWQTAINCQDKWDGDSAKLENYLRGSGTLEESIPIEVVKILSIQLLDKLQHHPVHSSLPKDVPSRKTFHPTGLASLVFSVNSIHQFVYSFFHERVIYRDGVELSNDLASFVTSSISKKMTATQHKVN